MIYLGLSDKDRDWMVDALCAQVDPDAFFPEKGGSVREAKAICARCPVKAECVEYGLSDVHGVWGGLSENERARVRDRRGVPSVRRGLDAGVAVSAA